MEVILLDEFAVIASDTARTKAYLQMMCKAGYLPGLCIVYTDEYKQMKKEADEYNPISEDGYFSLTEPVLYTIKKSEIKHIIIENRDINSDAISNVIREIDQKYVIYSGYGGSILKPHLFGLGKQFIHVHAGILPMYRGSTTAYYSILQENYIGATAIFLNEGIDEGEIITYEKYPRPDKKVNIDTLYEPYIRSKVLLKVIEQYLQYGILESKKQDKNAAQTYYIIHPVLKHIAIMRD